MSEMVSSFGAIGAANEGDLMKMSISASGSEDGWVVAFAKAEVSKMKSPSPSMKPKCGA